MRKALTTIALVLLACTASLSAYTYTGNDEDLIGGGVGLAYSRETYDNGSKTQLDKSAMLTFSVNDFIFMSASGNAGMYVEVGALFDVKSVSYLDDVRQSMSSAPDLLVDTVIGFGARMRMGDGITLLLGVGPELFYNSREYKGYNSTLSEYYKYTVDYMTLGAAATLEYMMRLDYDFYITAGVKLSGMFLSVIVEEYSSYANHEDERTYLEGYRGFRVNPRISFFFKY